MITNRLVWRGFDADSRYGPDLVILRTSRLPITDVAPGTPVEGPVDDLADWVQQIHRRAQGLLER